MKSVDRPPVAYEVTAEISNNGLISELTRLQAVEIDVSPLPSIEIALLTWKWLKMDGNYKWYVIGKPWSLYQQVTSFPVSNASYRPESVTHPNG